MILILPFPDIDPVLFSLSLGPLELALRWYALAYIVGLLLGLWVLKLALARPALWPASTPPMAREQADALLTWVILGVILGGRLGFVLFYQPGYYLANPADIVKVWQGGMAFHGGLIGVVLAAALFCWRHKLSFLSVTDGMALATPPGLMLGRMANFINGELWGRPSDLPWAVVFPDPRAQICPADWIGPCARHPSQLYQAGLEGLLLGLVLLWMAFGRGALRAPGRVAGTFFIGYALARFTVEFFRQPDAQFAGPDNPLGHAVQFGAAGLTMGQLLSLPMIGFGLLLLYVSMRHRGPA